MSNVKVSSLSPLPASSATYTYGITNANTEGKVAVGGNDGLAINNSSGVLTAPLGITTAGDTKVATVGKGVYIKEGTNATMGTLTLNGATEVTVSTTKVTASSRIFLTVQAPGGTPAGVAYVSSRSAGASFGVKGVALDTSTVAWLIVEPA